MRNLVTEEGEIIQADMNPTIVRFLPQCAEMTPTSDQEAPHHVHSMVSPVPEAGTAQAIRSTLLEVGGVRIDRVEGEATQVEEVPFISLDGVEQACRQPLLPDFLYLRLAVQTCINSYRVRISFFNNLYLGCSCVSCS